MQSKRYKDLYPLPINANIPQFNTLSKMKLTEQSHICKFMYLQLHHPLFVKHFFPIIFTELYDVSFCYYEKYFN